MGKHKKEEKNCTMMNILYMIGGLILGILIGYFLIDYVMTLMTGNTEQPQAPTQQPQAPTQQPMQTIQAMQPMPAQPAMPSMSAQAAMPAQTGGRRLFKNRYR
tara:strand:+ start:178 stop:486 length:309 start_codon:yes stop_codon:yes gene_type:complete